MIATLATGAALLATQLVAWVAYLAALRWYTQRPRTRRLPSL